MEGWVSTMTAPIVPDGPQRQPIVPDQRTAVPDGQEPRPAVPRGPQRQPPRVNASQLWAGGVATAIVAGLIALVGVLASRWLLNIPILSPRQAGAYGNAHTTALVLLAAAAALAATALIHLLLLSTPRPLAFFGWIIALATVVVVLLPFRTDAPLADKAATAIVVGVIGIAIGSLLTSVADRATRTSSPLTREPVDHRY
jgi:hypothetical protein